MDFLKRIMSTRSPSGYEYESRKIWKEELINNCDKIEADWHGNLYAILNESTGPKVMLLAHLDEIGFMVRYITEDGFIRFRTIGGVDTNIIQARKVIIKTKNGDIPGVIGRKAIHLLRGGDDAKKTPDVSEMFIDIGAKSKDEASSLVEIGDPITYDVDMVELRNGIFSSKAFDNKAGAFVVAEVVKNIHKRKNELKASIYAGGNCQEEVGLRGSHSVTQKVMPDVGIAVDTTFAIDTPHGQKDKEGNVKLGGGPAFARGANTNPKLLEMMIKICKDENIPYQLEAEPSGNGTDADAMQLISGGAVALVSVPIRYMHTQYETLDIKDVENTIKLLTKLCLNIDKNTDFTP